MNLRVVAKCLSCKLYLGDLALLHGHGGKTCKKPLVVLKESKIVQVRGECFECGNLFAMIGESPLPDRCYCKGQVTKIRTPGGCARRGGPWVVSENNEYPL